MTFVSFNMTCRFQEHTSEHNEANRNFKTEISECYHSNTVSTVVRARICFEHLIFCPIPPTFPPGFIRNLLCNEWVKRHKSVILCIHPYRWNPRKPGILAAAGSDGSTTIFNTSLKSNSKANTQG